MNGEQDPARGYVTDVFHFEKYVIPGACAVGMLLLFPWYLLGGSQLGTWDLGTAIIAALVVGHIIESLKVYRWGGKVEANYNRFNFRVEGLLVGWNVREQGNQKEKEALREKTKNIVFTLMSRAELSEFSWNLVRWQKMIVLAVITVLAAIEWFVFAVLAFCDANGRNIFRCDFKLVIVNPQEPFWWSLIGEGLIAVTLGVSAYYIYRYGLSRQERNNESYFQLILRHKDAILKQLELDADSTKG